MISGCWRQSINQIVLSLPLCTTSTNTTRWNHHHHNHTNNTNKPTKSTSNCKFTLLIKINSTSMSHKIDPMDVGHTDALMVKKFLKNTFGFFDSKDQEGKCCCHVLMDNNNNNESSRPPTRDNILQAFKDIVTHVLPVDFIFFWYNGHSHSIDQYDEDEETIVPRTVNSIVPIDFDTSGGGYILGNENLNLFVEQLPRDPISFI